jgi:hypothetical protein
MTSNKLLIEDEVIDKDKIVSLGFFLSPILFNFFINDFLENKIKTLILAFADNVGLICTSKKKFLGTIQ